MSRDEALRIYCALLARDPLPQQRFQDIGQRFALLAALSCEAAHQFDAAVERYCEEPQTASAAWDVNVHIPRRSDSDKERERSLLANARQDEHKIPLSQFDLVTEMGARK